MRFGRRPRALLGAIAAALVLLPGLALIAPGAPTAAAADATSSGLTFFGDATYDVLPDQGRVAVTVILTAANTLKDTKTKKFFFRVGYLTVLPNTANFRLKGASGAPKVTVISRTDAYTNLKVDFGANLPAGKSTKLTLTYDLKDPGGAPDRALRVSKSLISFGAWAVAAPGSTAGSVTVRFPSGYDVLVRRGPLTGPTPDTSGHDVWTSGRLSRPLDFVADFSADRPTAYAETERTFQSQTGPVTVAIQSWPDDPAWGQHVGSFVAAAVPVLEQLIGKPWPEGGPMQVREALVRSTGGYAGIYDPAARRIDISYAASDAVILHELAHAWFNGSLVADRWIAEGFAAYYADQAARELGVDPAPIPAPDPNAVPTPLNAWAAPSPDASATDAWAYAASRQLAALIAARAGGGTSLNGIWTWITAGVGAYQPATRPDEYPPPSGGEKGAPVPDWRGLLDLLEDNTGKTFGDLWRQWVTRPADLELLDDRDATRGHYLRTVATAGDWRLPKSIRDAMRAWRFDVAREQLVAADGVLAQRETLEKAAAAAGVTLPPTLQAAFEGDGGLAAAAAQATGEQAVVDAITAAQAAKPSGLGVAEDAIVKIGLLFEDPAQQLQDAAAGLGAGDLQPAYAAANRAEGAWRYAADNGRSRILSVILLAIATVLLIGMLRSGLIPAPRRVSGAAVGGKRTGTLAGHPADTADDEGAEPKA